MKNLSLYIVSSVLSILLSASAVAQVKTDVESSGLTGPVKSVEFGRIEHTLKDGRSVAGKRVPFQTTTFNAEGKKTQVIDYQDGSVTSRLVYTYDGLGRNTGYEEYHVAFDKSLSKPRRHEYLLDARGNRLQYTVYETDGSPGSRFVDVYDEQGDKVEEQYFYHTGASGGKTLHKYEEGRVVESLHRRPDGTVAWRNKFAYDGRGNRIEWVQYQGDTLRYTILYKYDGRGRVVEEETLEFNKPPDTWDSHAPVPGKVAYTYDDEKRTKEVATYDEGGSLKSKIIHTLDERGNEVGLMVANPDGSPKSQELHWYDKNKLLRTLSGPQTVKVEYDSRGNWTRKTHLIQPAGSGKPEAYAGEYRVITYY